MPEAFIDPTADLERPAWRSKIDRHAGDPEGQWPARSVERDDVSDPATEVRDEAARDHGRGPRATIPHASARLEPDSGHRPKSPGVEEASSDGCNVTGPALAGHLPP